VTDDDLASAFARRAPGALEETYRRYGDVLQRAARHVLGSPADARDCVHDALLRVWARQDSYRPERGTLRAFLIVCVRNDALSQIRRSGRHVALERRSAGPPAEHLDPAERLSVRAALAVLSPEHRAVIELAYWGELTQTEIATRLRLPLGTVKSRAAAGLRKLARTLTEKDGSDE
jgi:RNA polymerase sigma-70 factor (ECF subfamily)